jgi:hypothetical protein
MAVSGQFLVSAVTPGDHAAMGALLLDMHVIFRDISTRGSWCAVESERGL